MNLLGTAESAVEVALGTTWQGEIVEEAITGTIMAGVETRVVVHKEWSWSLLMQKWKGLLVKLLLLQQHCALRPGSGQLAGDSSPVEQGHDGGEASMVEEEEVGRWEWDEGRKEDQVCK